MTLMMIQAVPTVMMVSTCKYHTVLAVAVCIAAVASIITPASTLLFDFLPLRSSLNYPTILCFIFPVFFYFVSIFSFCGETF